MGADPLRIVHTVAPAVVGGLERVVQGLTTGLHDRGHDVHVISVVGPDDGDHPFPGPMRERGVEVHELQLGARAYLKERRALKALLSEIEPQVVHTHGYRPDLLHAPAARGMGIATVTTEHGTSQLGGKTRIYEWFQYRSFRRFQAVIAVSSPIASKLMGLGVPEEKLHVVPNAWTGGVEFLSREAARAELGLPADGTLVGFVGRLVRAKGADVFVDALLRLGEMELTGVVIGDGRQRPELEEAIGGAGHEDRFRLLGMVENAARYMRAFDLFVLSSRTEGTPIVLLEAVAAGVPTVVTRVGGVPDVVGETESLLVPSQEPDQIAAAIRRALEDRSASLERARSASERLAAVFGADSWIARHESLYRAVAARP